MNINNQIIIFTKVLCTTIALSIVGLGLYFLDSTFIRSDEAWYAVLLRDCPDQAIATQFYHLYGSLFGGDIYAYRLTQFILNLASLVVLSLGLYVFFYRSSSYHWRTVGSIYAFLLCFTYMISASMLPNYINMNAASTNCALGFFLLGYVRSNRWCYVLSGAFFASLMMIMVTNMGLYALCLLALLILTRRVVDVLYSLGGALLFFLVYFAFLQDFHVYVANFKELFFVTQQRGSSDYGMIFLLTWTLRAIWHMILFSLIGGSIIYLAYRWMRRTHVAAIRIGFWMIYVGVITVVFLCFVSKEIDMLAPYATEIARLQQLGLTPFVLLSTLVGFAYILIFLESKLSVRDKMVLAVFFVVPLLLAIGSNVPYIVRGRVYLVYWAPALYVLIVIMRGRESSFIALGGVLLASACYYASVLSPNWFGQRHLEQTAWVAQLGVYVHEKEASLLREASQRLNAQDNVLVHFSWASAFVSGAKIMDYNYRMIPSSAARRLNERYPDLENFIYMTFKRHRYTVDELLVALAASRKAYVSGEETIGDLILFSIRMAPYESREPLAAQATQ